MSDDKREQEERPRIKVTDRRLFDSDGNFRSDSPVPERSGSADPLEDPTTAMDSASLVADRSDSPQPAETGADVDPVATAAAEDSTSGPAVSEPQPAADSSPTATPRSETGIPGAGVAADAEPGSGQPRGPRELPRDLSGFVESQYFETLLYLGAIPHPQTGQPAEDLELAQYKIDLLSMLQEKTEGNRTPEESKILEDVLYQVRMLFLQKRKVAKL